VNEDLRGEWWEWPLEPLAILAVLERDGIEYVVVGGFAAVVHGSPLPTYDLDITPAPGRRNLRRLGVALAELGSGHDGKATLELLLAGRDCSFSTRFGYVDVVMNPAGTRGYADLRRHAARVLVAEGLSPRIASLADVVRIKEASGRAHDLAHLPALRTLLEMTFER